MEINNECELYEVRDVFGNPYTVNLSGSWDDIEENLPSDAEVIEKTYGEYVHGMCDGVAYLDLETGEVIYGSSYQGSTLIRSAETPTIYRISMNLDFEDGDLFTPEELHEMGEIYGDSCEWDREEYAEKSGESLGEREIKALIEYGNPDWDEAREVYEEIKKNK